ncbi:hypothetical protein N2152v2_008942 [Parachlorella kessleri]
MLDQRELKTPARHPLVVPTRSLALAIAAEWEWQVKRIQPFTMPLMSLAATAIDQPKDRESVIETMLEYLHTDPVCCRHEPGKLADLQQKVYEPIVEWVQQDLGVQLHITDSIFGAELTEEAIQGIRSFLQGLDGWHLAAAEQLSSSCKSVLIALAIIQGQLGVDAGLAAARLEEELQIREWGLVEGGHDIDIADLRVREFLASLSRCAYTAARVRDRFLVANWGLHLERLRRSLQRLQDAAALYPGYYEWLIEAHPHNSETAVIDQVIRPTVLQSLSQLATAEDAMLVVALLPASAKAELAVMDGPSSPGAPLSVLAFAGPYASASQQQGVLVSLACGMPRSIAEAKDSAWVAARVPFEKAKPEGVAEVVLCSPQGQVLEGLVTNFFVVADDGRGGCVVLTAPSDGIVWGTMRQQVLHACKTLGVPAREESPDVATREAWREAFLTSRGFDCGGKKVAIREMAKLGLTGNISGML